MLQLRFHPVALQELLASIDWYDRRAPGLGAEFLRDVEVALDRILFIPSAFPITVANSRRLILDRFPYALVYRPKSEHIEIIAVVHLHRRPGYWVDRL